MSPLLKVAITGTHLLVSFTTFVILIIMSFVVVLFSPHDALAASKATQITTGYEHACAVVDYRAQCWGSNSSGQLGTGRTNKAAITKPQAVAQNKDPITETKKCTASLLGNCISWAIDTPYSPASALAGKSVTRISAGYNHTCALASATVYCWGDNSHGQLGNRSKTGSSVPVAVDTKAAWTKVEPAHCNGSSNFLTGCAAPTGTWVPEKRTDYPASALVRKEIVDISAAEYYTCALASDGSVACWGEGDNGRLGTNTTTDADYPVAVYNQGALVNKKGIRLAKASGDTMCVLAVDATTEIHDTTKGYPYCWGYGIDDGTSLPAGGDSTVACSKNSTTTKPANGNPKEVIFSSKQPVRIQGSMPLTAIDGASHAQAYVTSSGADTKAYYWGRYGYRVDEAYSNISTCKYTCQGVKVGFASRVELAKVSVHSTGAGSAHSTRAGYGVAGGSGNGRFAPPAAQGYTSVGGNNCPTTTHYGYTKTTSYTTIGQKAVTAPPETALTSGIRAFSGNAYNGLYCAVKVTDSIACDANGTSVDEGQTGSGYVKQCTPQYAYNAFGQKYKSGQICTPTPTGPQPVVSNGWLAGKYVTRLSVGSSGYACMIASGRVGCWGENGSGQLGIGTTDNKNVPTGVEL